MEVQSVEVDYSISIIALLQPTSELFHSFDSKNMSFYASPDLTDRRRKIPSGFALALACL